MFFVVAYDIVIKWYALTLVTVSHESCTYFDVSTHLVFDMSGVATLCVNTRLLCPGVSVRGCGVVLPRIDIGIDHSVERCPIIR